MSASKTITIKCDGGDMADGGTWPQDFTACRSTFTNPDGAQNNADVRKAAKTAGWKTGNWDYCPIHVGQAS